MTRKEHERRAAEALAKKANGISAGYIYSAGDWLENPIPSGRAAITLLADAYEQIERLKAKDHTDDDAPDYERHGLNAGKDTPMDEDFEAQARQMYLQTTGCLPGRLTEELIARLLSDLADRDATIARYEATAREIRSMCYEAAENGSLPDKQHALRNAVNLAATIAPPKPMTAEDALEALVREAWPNSTEHGHRLSALKRASAKLGFAVVAKEPRDGK